ncbi:MAG: hypothetical protein ISS31_10910 [Kiritimatiellae bacterium]|nr:hypothetical protein [Kiritimatiellia bacterium]
MNRLLILLTVLMAFAMVTVDVTAAEGDEHPAAQMEEVDLDEEAADLEEDDFNDDDDGITLDFVINAIPAALLIDMSGNNFGITEDGTGARSEASSVYMMPSLSAGIGASVSDKIYLDALLGAGVLVNESLRSFFVQGTISATFMASQSLNIGPRIGLIQFLSTEWLDDQDLLDEVDFEDSTGMMFGLQIAMGDRVRYLVNIDYITMDFDVNAPLGVTPDDDEFELEGLAVQFGVRGEF